MKHLIIVLLFVLSNLISFSQPCLISDVLKVIPLPVNGTYKPGTTVKFCYTITYWANVNYNYLLGVVPTFGPGWDVSTLTPIGQPATAHALVGNWIWTSPVTGTTLGNTIPYPGWWFDNLEGAFWPWLDGNPGNNWGDGYNDVGHGPWMFCWEITTLNCPPSSNGASLAMKILTHSDYEMGSWAWPGCYNDPVHLFNATIDCCPTIYTSKITHY